MKTAFKYLLLLTGLLFGIIALSFFLYKSFTVNALREKKGKLDSKWLELFENSTTRTILLSKLTSHRNGVVSDSLKISVKNNLKYRGNFENECSINFVDQEYLSNKWYLEFLQLYKSDSVFRLAKLII